MEIEIYRDISTEETSKGTNPMLQMLRDRLPPRPAVSANYLRIFLPRDHIILKRFEVTDELTVVGRDEHHNIIVHMPLSEVEKVATKPKNNTAGILSKTALLYEYAYAGPHNAEMRNIVTDTVVKLLKKNIPDAIIAEIDGDIRINGDKFSGIDKHSVDANGVSETHDFAIQTMYYDKDLFDLYLTSTDKVTNRGITGIQNHNANYSTEEYIADLTAALRDTFSYILKESVRISTITANY